MKKIADLPEARIDLPQLDLYLKRQIILPPVGDDMKEAGDLLPRFHARSVKTVKNLILTAAETLCHTFHAKVRGCHPSFRQKPIRSVHEKRALADPVCPKGQIDSRAGKVQRTVVHMKFAV